MDFLFNYNGRYVSFFTILDEYTINKPPPLVSRDIKYDMYTSLVTVLLDHSDYEDVLSWVDQTVIAVVNSLSDDILLDDDCIADVRYNTLMAIMSFYVHANRPYNSKLFDRLIELYVSDIKLFNTRLDYIKQNFKLFYELIYYTKNLKKTKATSILKELVALNNPDVYNKVEINYEILWTTLLYNSDLTLKSLLEACLNDSYNDDDSIDYSMILFELIFGQIIATRDSITFGCFLNEKTFHKFIIYLNYSAIFYAFNLISYEHSQWKHMSASIETKILRNYHFFKSVYGMSDEMKSRFFDIITKGSLIDFSGCVLLDPEKTIDVVLDHIDHFYKQLLPKVKKTKFNLSAFIDTSSSICFNAICYGLFSYRRFMYKVGSDEEFMLREKAIKATDIFLETLYDKLESSEMTIDWGLKGLLVLWQFIQGFSVLNDFKEFNFLELPNRLVDYDDCSLMPDVHKEFDGFVHSMSLVGKCLQRIFSNLLNSNDWHVARDIFSKLRKIIKPELIDIIKGNKDLVEFYIDFYKFQLKLVEHDAETFKIFNDRVIKEILICCTKSKLFFNGMRSVLENRNHRFSLYNTIRKFSLVMLVPMFLDDDVKNVIESIYSVDDLTPKRLLALLEKQEDGVKDLLVSTSVLVNDIRVFSDRGFILNCHRYADFMKYMLTYTSKSHVIKEWRYKAIVNFLARPDGSFYDLFTYPCHSFDLWKKFWKDVVVTDAIFPMLEKANYPLIVLYAKNFDISIEHRKQLLENWLPRIASYFNRSTPVEPFCYTDVVKFADIYANYLSKIVNPSTYIDTLVDILQSHNKFRKIFAPILMNKSAVFKEYLLTNGSEVLEDG